MGTYVGSATVVIPDRTTFDVNAYLQSVVAPGLEIWRGVVRSDDTAALQRIATLKRAVLQLPSGHKGWFEPEAPEGLAAKELRITGQGPPPF